MIDFLPNDKHIKFYEIQLKEMELERKRYVHSPVNKLWAEGRLFFGRIWKYDEAKGQLILRFKKDSNKKSSLPRLKVPYQLCVVGSDAPSSPKDFTFSYNEFRESKSVFDSRCVPAYTKKGGDEWRLQGCDQVTLELVSKIKPFLDQGIHPLIILAEEDPPYKYLQNLQQFVLENPRNTLLNSQIDIYNSHWQPTNLPPHNILLDRVLELIDENDNLIIQGPPGTGKTQMIAGICSSYMANGFGVCVTALTNKALVEVCQKDPLSAYLRDGHIYKTNLTSDERKKCKGLREAKDLMASSSELLLTTYYKLSQDLTDLNGKKGKFDILIIEEASQAYLATIAGFIELGVKVLMVGDPMQMYPIVQNQEKVNKLHHKIENAIRGLEVYSYANESISYRIKDSFRLTTDACEQTGIFYNDSLNSVSTIDGLTNVKGNSKFIPKNGETHFILNKLSASTDVLISQAVEIATNLKQDNKTFEVAILSNLKKTVDDVYDKIFDHFNSLDGFTIETIDRIQGMTCDICIVVVESSAQFAFLLNRFNVATSRSTRGTIFIARNSIEHMQSINPLVKRFIDKSNKILISES